MAKKKLNKKSNQDFIDQVQSAGISGYHFDHDDSYVYFKEYQWEDSTSELVRYAYTVDANGVVTIDKESEQYVVRDTNYTVIPEPSDTSTMEKVLRKLLKEFMPTSNQSNIIKQFDEETYTVTEPLYIAYGEVDGHGHTYKNKEAVYQLVKAVEEGRDAGTLQPSLFHVIKSKQFTIGKAWVNEEECMLGDTLCPALQPLVEITFKSKKAFNARKDGKLAGLSIGALGTVDLVKDLFSDLTSSTTPTHLLSNFSFAHKNAHIAYTDWSVGGAASLKNHYYLEKAMVTGLNKEQEDLAKDLEDELVPLDKKLSKDSDDTAPSTPNGAVNAGVDNEPTKGNENDMSVELQKQIDELKTQLKAANIEKSLAKYSLDEKDNLDLSTALADLTDDKQAIVLKVLDAVIAKHEQEKTEIQKQLDVKVEDKELSPLEKSLSQEEGTSTEIPSGKKMSLAEEAAEQIKKSKAK
jgi:hypothetical protein